MIRQISSARGQSIAEYLVLFATVIGAAVAMQQYVKTRLQGGVAGTADGFMNAAISAGGFGTFEPDRTTTTTTSTTTGLSMTGARVGTRSLDTASDSSTTIQK